jgi:hypothetical protein
MRFPLPLNLVKFNSFQVVVNELRHLFSVHGQKMWEILSTVKKTEVVDQHRPRDLPRDKAVQGKPKQRNAKPRAANPFKRRRILDSQVKHGS